MTRATRLYPCPSCGCLACGPDEDGFDTCARCGGPYTCERCGEYVGASLARRRPFPCEECPAEEEHRAQ